MSTYRSSRTADQRIADDFMAGQMACGVCAKLSPKEDLSTYGARCFDCYIAYCRQGRQYPPLSLAQRKEMAGKVRAALAGGLRASPKQHMEHLAELERRGEATPGQRGFLAASRRMLGGGVEPAPVAASSPTSDPNTHAFAGPARPVAPPTHPEPDDAPAWVTEDQQ